MSGFSPIRQGALKVNVSTTASEVTPAVSSTSSNKTMLVYNAGPDLAFIEPFYPSAGQSNGVNLNTSHPLPPRSSIAMPWSNDSHFGLISEGTSVVYLSFGTGDVQGMASAAAEVA